MPIYKLTPEAEADLEKIWAYIAQESPDSATRLLRSIHNKLTILAEFPDIGRSRPDVDPADLSLRSFVCHKNYIAYYHPAEYGIEIGRVLHAARDILPIFTKEESGE